MAALSVPAASTSPLRVGVTPVLPPMVHQENGKVVGVEVDFAQVLAKDLGRPIQWVTLKWDEQIPALIEERTDIIMSGMSVTRAREFRVAFTKPYLEIGQMALIRRTDSLEYVFGIPVLPTGVFGVKKGTTGDFLVQTEFPKARRRTFDTGAEGARALARGRIDFFVADSPLVWWLEGMNEGSGLQALPGMLSREYLAWAVRKTDTELLAQADATLDRLQKSGEALAILKRWIPNLK
jgi:ABC-type amino acid transport substrate-binding protein